MEHLENDFIKISVKPYGAELTSIINKANGKEMLWQGDPVYWKRQSPILFPIVGSVWNNTYRYNGVEYTMNQHGFARDMDFTLINKSDTSILFELQANEETKKLYPADFSLKIGYELIDNSIKVIWNVTNNGSDEMFFQIGAHPAFNYKDYNPEANVQGYFSLLPIDTNYRLSTITQKGCIGNEISKIVYQEHCIIPITKNTFNNDALILEDSQVISVELLDSNRKPYIKLSFDAPVVGLWSPIKQEYAPFVCIEPWYGRCDKVGYEGEFSKRDWVFNLGKKDSFKTYYTIEIL